MTNPTFADVARTIAKGKPPEWLIKALEQRGEAISVETDQSLRHCIEQMYNATTMLMKLLPAFELMPLGAVHNFRVIQDALPLLKKDLERTNRKLPANRMPNIQREICAAVVVESWAIIHGKPEPRSSKLEQACADYWQACRGETVDPANWRLTIQRALKNDHKWVRQVLLAAQKAT